MVCAGDDDQLLLILQVSFVVVAHTVCHLAAVTVAAIATMLWGAIVLVLLQTS